MKLQGAQQAKADAETRKAEAIAGAIGSAGEALGYGAEMIDTYNGKSGAKLSKKGYNSEEIAQILASGQPIKNF